MSSELEYLIRNLKDLKESKDCVESIKQILSIFENLTEFTCVDQYLATLIVPGNDEDDGIIGFLRTKNGDKEFEKATYEGLTLIKWILDNRRSEFVANVVHFIFLLKDICKILSLSHLGSSRVKVLSLECLITLLDTNMDNIKNDKISRTDLDIADLYWKILPTTEETKQSATVRGKMFHLLGLLAHLGHNHFMDKKEKITQLFNHLINQINKQVTSHYSKLEVSIVQGCIKGLDYFLKSYSETDILKQSKSQNGSWVILYDNLFKIIDPGCSISYANENDKTQNKLKRREFQRAGLELFANHGTIFRQNFLQDHRQWYADFLAWALSNNSDDTRAGNKAMNSLFKSITSYSEDRDNGTIDTNAKLLLEKAANFFITSFRRILNNKESTRGEMNIAVKGIGLVSSICSDTTEKDSLFDKLTNQIETVIVELNVPITDKYSGSFLLIPTYIESVGEMLFSFSMQISDEDSLKTFQERLAVVEQLVTLLITFYPDFGRAKLTSPFSVVKLAESLYKKHNKYFLPFFENVFNDALTQIIASPTKLEADILNAAAMSQAQENPNPKGNQKPNYVKTIHSYVPLFQFMINSEEYLKYGNEENRKVISSLYDIILQWILNTIGKLDLTIEFIEDDLEIASDEEQEPTVNTRPKMLRDFQLFINLVEFFQEFVNETDDKLLENWIKIYLLEMLKFINQNPLVSGFYKIFSKVLEVSRKVDYFKDKDGDKDKEQLFESCCDFFKSLTYKIHEYRDDLLISVLDIWLSAPNEFILKSENISSLEVTLQAIFRNGKNYFPLAAKGIEAIERWFLIRDMDDQQKYDSGRKPLEEFENLFRNLFPIFKSYFTSVGETNPVEKKPVVEDKKKSKSKKNFGLRQRRIIQSELKDLDLKQLQLKILRLIGSFGNLLNIDEESEKICFSFDDEKFLKFAVPFADIKPDIYLDNFLPRVLDICQNSSDRQLRSASCEFLHSVVLYFLGSSQRQAGSSGSREIFTKIFNVSLKLGCDSDLVVQQLFNPLTIQVVHWLTKPSSKNTIGFELADICLRIIIEGLVQSDEIPLRDFSGVCLYEFFAWSIKQSNSEQTQNVIRNITAMSTHASFEYRQGSVLGFNKIYRQFREDSKLRNTYTFQLFRNFILGLSISSDLSGDSLLIRNTKQSISHLERILVKYASLFNVKIRPQDRPHPKDFEGNTLKNLVDWLLEYCASNKSICRKESIRLIKILSKLVKVNQNSYDLEKIVNEFVISKPGEILRFSDKILKNDSFDLSQALCASGEYYSLLEEANYSSFNQVLNNESIFISKLEAILNDSDKINQEFLFCLSQMSFLARSSSISSEIKGKILDTTILVSKRISLKLKTLLKLWNTLWNSKAMDLDTELRSKIRSHFQLNLNVHGNENELSQNVDWFLRISNDEDKLIEKVLSREEIKSICEDIWSYIESKLYHKESNNDLSSVQISQKKLKMLEKLLLLGLRLGYLDDHVERSTFSTVKVIKNDSIASLKQKVSKGDLFQQYFISALVECKKLLDFKTLKDQRNIIEVGNFIQKLLVFVKNNREQRTLYGTTIVQNASEIWPALSLNCEIRNVSTIISGLASIDMKACRGSSTLVKWWSKEIQSQERLKLSEKAELFHFLPLFGLSDQKENVELVIEAIDIFVKEDMGHKNVNYSLDECYITKIFLKIASFYSSIPENTQVFEILTNFLARISLLSENSPCFNSFRKLLENAIDEVKLKGEREITFKKNIKGNQLVDRIFKVIKERLDGNFLLMKFGLIPALSKLSSHEFKSFYEENIVDILELISINAKTSKDWVRKTIGFQLIEILSIKGQKGLLKGQITDKSQKNSQLNNIYLENHERFNNGKPKPEEIKGNELLKYLVTNCQRFTSHPTPKQTDKDVKEANFQANCASYNAFVATIQVTQDEEKFLMLLMEERPDKKYLIWKNIIDCEVEINFPHLLQYNNNNDKVRPPRQVGSSALGVVGLQNSEEIPNFLKANKNLNTNKQVLASSSLRCSAASFDFTSSFRVENCDFYNDIYNIARVDSNNKGKDTSKDKDDDKMESTQLIFSHDCNQSIANVFKILNKCSNVSKDVEGIPKWINIIISYLNNDRCEKNIKVFLVGAILNTSDKIFQSYSKIFFEPILRGLVRGVFGNQLNHFVKDIIITLLGWTEVTKHFPPANLIKSTLEFMVNNLQSDQPRPDVYKNSLSILQATVKQWVIGGGGEIGEKLPYTIIKRKLSDNQDLRAGVEICKSFLRSDQLPYPVNDTFDLIEKLNQGLKSPSKPFYTSTGETFGHLLSVLKKMEDQTMFSRSLIVIKRKLEIQRETRLPPFLVMVSSIQKYFPGFFNEYKSPIYELLCDRKLKSEALLLMPDIFEEELRIVQDSPELSREKAEETYTELLGRKVFDVALSGISELKCGLKLFKLFLKNMPNYGEDKFMKLFNWIENAETCTDELVRKDFADILSNIYDVFGRKDMSNYRQKLTKLAQRAEKIFIRLYKDESKEVEQVVHSFWEKNLQAGKKSPDLILELMELLAEEEDSLRIALDLIMKRCSSSPDFGKKIFDKPLEEGQFFEYKLDTSWRFKNASHAPLFAESISSSQNFAALPQTLKSSIMGGTLGTARLGMNLLKSTLASCKLQFSLTQENAKNSFDDSQSNYPDLYENRFRSAESQEVLDNGEMMDVDVDTANSSSLNSLPSSLSSLRRKFYDNSSSTENFYASREINRQKAQMDKSIEQAKNKRVGVSLVRKYRIGEMPDIEIKHSDFLLTVLNITKADEETGKAFFVHLFTCLCNEMKNNGSNIEQFIQNTRITLDRIFKKSSSGLSPNFAAALIEIATENRIPIEAHLISKIALNFDIQKVSILKFEEEFLNLEETGEHPPSNKRAKTSNLDLGKNAEKWIRMAELYKDLDNFDSIRNIFSKISSQASNDSYAGKCKSAQEALHWENCGDYRNALEIYDELCAKEKEEDSDDDLNLCMLKFYDDAIFKCLKNLSNWEDCYIRADENHREMSTDSNYLEKCLPNKIKAGLEIIIRNDDESEDSLFNKFQEFVSKLDSNSEVNAYVLENHPIELSTIRATYEDWPSCVTHLDSSFDSALKSFIHFNNISNIHKKEQILDIQKAAFLKDIVEWTKIHKEFEDKRDFNTFEEKTENLITKWSRASTGQSISLYNCDMLVALRQYFGTLMMSEKIDKITEYPQENLKNKLGSFILKQNLWCLNVAILNKNNDVAINYLKESKKIDPQDIQLMVETGRYLSTFTESRVWISVWTKGWKNLEKYCSTNDATEVQSELFLSLLKHVKMNEQLNDQEYGQVIKTLHIADARKSQFLPNTIEKAVNFVRNSVLGDENDMVENELTNGNALMCFYNLLRYILMNFSNDNIDKKEIHKLMTMSLLRGMKSGNFEATKLFPSCFPALEEYPEIHSDFTQITSDIGPWKFLPWLDQIIAHSKTPSIKPLLGKLIGRILDSYPQAFQLQYPELLQRKNGSNICSTSYAKSLGSLVLPHILFEVNAIFHYDTKNSSGIFLKNLLEFEKSLNEKLENPEIYGSIHTDFVNEILSDVCTTIEKVRSKGIDSQSLVQSQEQDDSSVLGLKNEFLSKVRKLNDRAKRFDRVNTIKLEDICPWLSNFHFTDWDEIEIPGLYNDFRRSAPKEDLHPKIVSFDKTLLLLDSKAKPIRLTMIANNGKKYRYLAKFGDDLRQDKRIQQLFRLANEIFKTDPNCSQRSLNVKTYSVIPISKKFGLIQWVDKSLQLREFLFKKSDRDVFDQSKLKYHKWIHSTNNKGFKDNDTGNIYGCVAKQSRANVESNFKSVVKSIPQGIFRDKVRAAAYGLEEYFSLRERMIRSYSTMCLIHWLLGIGDRHLGNCMISLVDGEFLGIDFGYSFGTAITLISVPELMPFRLTPQLETFLMPYGHFGLFKETMLFAWRALLKSANLISIVAEIFIKEPNFTFGKKIGFVNNVQIERLHPIEILRDKLRGKNPLKLLHHELQFVAYKALAPNWTAVIEEGRKELFEKEYVDEDVMVDCLISLASDYNVLGRTFVGWSPWV